jgi:hypothetical protein
VHVHRQIGRHPADHDPRIGVVHRGQDARQHRLTGHGQRRFIRTAHPPRRTTG